MHDIDGWAGKRRRRDDVALSFDEVIRIARFFRRHRHDDLLMLMRAGDVLLPLVRDDELWSATLRLHAAMSEEARQDPKGLDLPTELPYRAPAAGRIERLATAVKLSVPEVLEVLERMEEVRDHLEFAFLHPLLIRSPME